MSTTNGSKGNPSLDAGRPATSGKGKKASSTSGELADLTVLETLEHQLRCFHGAVSLIRMAAFESSHGACLINGLLANKGDFFADNGEHYPDRVDWLMAKELLQDSCDRLHQCVDELDEGLLTDAIAWIRQRGVAEEGWPRGDEIYKLRHALWKVTCPMRTFLSLDGDDEAFQEIGEGHPPRSCWSGLWNMLAMFEDQLRIVSDLLVEVWEIADPLEKKMEELRGDAPTSTPEVTS